ncbi:MAG: hypothetical protein EHM41_04415 [Chloroflexi bacterium]|nr:MAG: hypothetical protein EHM41_04415 [Chloroflexota bacterium]
MFNGKIGFREELIIAARHEELLKQAEAVRMLDEIHTETNKHPTRLRIAAGWFGNQLVKAGSYLVDLSQPENVSAECIEMT